MIRPPKSKEKELGAIELLEQATALLRAASAEALACYYLGSLPFFTALLWFWADMSRSADADLRLSGSALALALLFVWMKVWQSRFAAHLTARLRGETELPPVRGSIMVQGALQPWGFIVLPLAGLVTLPLGWCYAFFQNLTVLGGLETGDAYRRARKQAALWPLQNHLLLALLALLALVLFINLAVSAFFLPRLLKTLFGIETVFTRSNLLLLNSTFWACVAIATHLCIDPLIKACYVLRCHYGESLASGADLRAQLKTLAARSLPLLLLTVLLFSAVPAPAAGTDALPQQPPPTQRIRQLDAAIEQTVQEPRFAWRLPRDTGLREKRELPGFMQATLDWCRDTAVTVGGWIRDGLRWLAKKLPKPKPSASSRDWGSGFADYALPLLYGLLAVLLCVGAVYAWRRLRRDRQQQEEPEIRTVAAVPDLHDEAVTADELSEERWTALARELLAKGELRLALRALYLGTLAALSEAGLVAIARFKTNHDYERELRRFSHALPQAAEAFSLNLRLFEAAWYGLHLPDQPALKQYLDNHARIVSHVRPR